MASFSSSVQRRLCFSNDVQKRLEQAFNKENMALSIEVNHIVIEGSCACSKEKIESIVRSAGFCPLILNSRVDRNFVFTVSPFNIPAIFIKKYLEVDEGVYFQESEITKLLSSHVFGTKKTGKETDKWLSVNSFRSHVSPALNQALVELISTYAKSDFPVIEIGSGIGYSVEELPNVIRTQPSKDECMLLSRSIPTPVYQLDVKGVYRCLSKSGKKVPLFFALDVFDTLSPELRRASFSQLSQLQNSGDRILIMLDTNPLFDEMLKQLGSLHPDHVILPYYPLSDEPTKLSVIVVPAERVEFKSPSVDEVIEMMKQEAQALVATGSVSSMQSDLHQLQSELNLQVISLEDYFAEQVKMELEEEGYKVDIHYHNSFTFGALPKGLLNIKQDLVYKSVTGTASLRQWDLADKKLFESLSEKGLTLPDEFNEEFLLSLRKRQQKVFGAEVLVINARKI